MHTCRATCLVMLRTNQAIRALAMNLTQPLSVRSEIIVLHKCKEEMYTTAYQTEPETYGPASADPDYTKLMRCSAALMTTLLEKLNALQHSSTIPGAENRRNSASHCLFDLLWALMYLTCQFLYRLPETWPFRDHGNSTSLRSALHSLMEFFLRVSRHGKSKLWSLVAEDLGAERAAHEAAVLHVLMAYINNIRDPPGQDLRQRLADLPSNFISMLCCLAIERHDDSPAHLRELLAADRLDPARPLLNIQPLVVLGNILRELFFSVIEANNDVVDLPGCLTPAVIQLYARIFFTGADQLGERAADDNHANLNTICLLLQNRRKCLEAANSQSSKDTSASAPKFQVCEDAAALPRPADSATNADLLCAMFANMPVNPDRSIKWYESILLILQERSGDPMHTLDPRDSEDRERVRIVCLAAHHLCVESVAWMRQQQQQLHQIGVRDQEYCLFADMLLTNGYAGSATWGRLLELEAACGE